MFLLSPASSSGKRAELLFREAAAFPLALALRSPDGVPIGEVFAFLSGLYFRGKLAYARRFARSPEGLAGQLVITPTRGLVPADTPITLSDLAEFATVDIHPDDPRYRAPLERDARALARACGTCEVVLLGSIASGKYVDVFQAHLTDRLRFPAAFVGRGDMSRGGLMLRAVEAGDELATIPVAGAVRRGKRPARLVPAKKPAARAARVGGV